MAGSGISAPSKTPSAPSRSSSYESRRQLLLLAVKFLRHDTAERIEKLFVLGQFFGPFFMVDAENFGDAFMVDVEALQIEVVRARHPADRRFACAAALPQRSMIHLRTRMFSPKPGQRNLPSASLRNQFTWKIARRIR